MPVCEALYSKALKVLPDAPLYSNRSAVRLALGRFDDAFEDATKATQTDSSYAKGYYRLGQAGEKCGKLQEAKKAYEKGKELAPESKVWPSSLLKLEKAKQAYEAKPKKKAETAPDLLAPRTAQPIPEKGKENARKSGAVPASENHAARRRRGGGVDLPCRTPSPRHAARRRRGGGRAPSPRRQLTRPRRRRHVHARLQGRLPGPQDDLLQQ